MSSRNKVLLRAISILPFAGLLVLLSSIGYVFFLVSRYLTEWVIRLDIYPLSPKADHKPKLVKWLYKWAFPILKIPLLLCAIMANAISLIIRFIANPLRKLVLWVKPK